MDKQNTKNKSEKHELLALLELICGLFMIVFSTESMGAQTKDSTDSISIIVKTFGIVAAAYGIITFVIWLIYRKSSNPKSTIPSIVTGIFGVVAGACLIFLSDQILAVFTIIAGIFAAVFGIIKIPGVFGMKKSGFKLWFIMFIPIAAIVAVGIIIGLSFQNPNNTVTSVLLGVAMILGCAADIIAIAGAVSVENRFSDSEEIDAPQLEESKDEE